MKKNNTKKQRMIEKKKKKSIFECYQWENSMLTKQENKEYLLDCPWARALF